MKAPDKIICNSRVLNSPVTGVQRYTIEILGRLPQAHIRRIAPPLWLKRPFNLLWEQLVLPWRMWGNKTLWSPSNSGALFVKRQFVTVHDASTVDFPSEYSRFYRLFYDLLFPRLLPRIAGVITVSDYSRRRLIEFYKLDPRKVHAIPLGVDHARFKPQSAAAIEKVRHKLGLPPRYILFLGTFTIRKNVGQLIRAWTAIQNDVAADIQLVLAGGAAVGHVFKENQLPPIPPRTLLTGRIDEGDLAPLLAGASVFVFPSLYEGFGLPPLEAMACGTPCITSNVTSLPEVVGDSGLTVSPHDDAALATALKRVLTDPPLAAALRDKGIARAAGFSWERAAAETWDILNQPHS